MKHAESFNDPFECLPQIIQRTESTAREWLKDPFYQAQLQTVLLENGTIKNIDEFQGYLQANEETLVRGLLSTHEDTHQNYR